MGLLLNIKSCLSIMKILVPIKDVINPDVDIKIEQNQSIFKVDTLNISMNPFDEVALEEAIRIKEYGTNVCIVVVSIGNKNNSKKILQTALEMGADRAIF